MKRVLIISYYFGKKELIGSIRLRGLAKYLKIFGWQVTILSGTKGDNGDFKVINIINDDILMKWKKVLKLNINKSLKEQMNISTIKNRQSFIPPFAREQVTLHFY